MANSSRDGFKVKAIKGGLLAGSEGQAITNLDEVHAEIVKGNAPKYKQRKEYDDLRARVNDGDASVSPLDLKAKKEAYMAANENVVNYLATNNELSIVISELNGRMLYQEDRVKAASLPEFSALDEKERKTALMLTPKLLHEIIVNAGLGKSNGSTLSTAVILGNKVYSVSLGDSPAYTCKINNDKVEVTQLNEIIHRKQKIKGILAVNEALGDTDYDFEYDGSPGVSHEPKFNIQTIDLKQDEKGLVIVSCDGLTESVVRENKDNKEADINKLSVVWIQNKLKPITTYTPDAMATTLVQTAYEENSTDNISCMIATIDPNETVAKYASVFDGHGGDEVSEAAYQLFDAVLNYQILLIKLKNLSGPLAKNLEEFLKIQSAQKTIPEINKLYENYNQTLRFLINSLSKDKDSSIALIIDLSNKKPVLNVLHDLKQHVASQKSGSNMLFDFFTGRRSAPERDFAIRDINAAERRLELLDSNVMDSFLNEFIATVNNTINDLNAKSASTNNYVAGEMRNSAPNENLINNKVPKISIYTKLLQELEAKSSSLTLMKNTRQEPINLQIVLNQELNDLQKMVSNLKEYSVKIPKIGWYTSATGSASKTTALLNEIDTKLITLSEKYSASPIKSYKK